MKKYSHTLKITMKKRRKRRINKAVCLCVCVYLSVRLSPISTEVKRRQKRRTPEKLMNEGSPVIKDPQISKFNTTSKNIIHEVPTQINIYKIQIKHILVE